MAGKKKPRVTKMCPLCMGKAVMIEKEHFVQKSPFSEYYVKLYELKGKCDQCGLEYHNGWQLSWQDLPSPKQSFAIGLIENVLDVTFEGVTKYDASLFLNSYLDDAKEYAASHPREWDPREIEFEYLNFDFDNIVNG